MDEIELREKIARWEDHHTEFKERLPDNENLVKSLVCFANSDGGWLIMGVNREGDILGIDDPDSALRKLDDLSSERCEPPVSLLPETLRVEGKIVVTVYIPKGNQRPYRTKSGLYYIRSGNRCRQASWDEVRRLYQTSESVFYDESPVSKASVENLDLEYIRIFLSERFNIGPGVPIDHYLQNLKITSEEKPTLAGLLFFGQKPQAFLPFAKVIAAFIPGRDLSIPPADRKDLEGKVPEVLDSALKFIGLYLKAEHRIQGFEPEVYSELPMEVMREGIVNAIAHRDYTVAGPIRLLIFEDRIEIRTPGRLPNTVTIDSMRVGGSHVLRNPTLYILLNKIGMVTDIGSGVMRIIKLVRDKLGKDVGLEASETEFVLTVPRK